jgi:hypothetical protein
LAAGVLSVASSRAAVITYSSYASWSAGLTDVATVTIPQPFDVTDGYDYLGQGDASVTYSGLVFSASSAYSESYFYNVGTVWSQNPPVVSSQLPEPGAGESNILVSLPTYVTSFALNYGTYAGENVTFTLSNGDSVTQGSTSGDWYGVVDFLGVTDSTPFDSVLLTSGTQTLSLNNVSYGAPEPAAWLLLATGLAGLLAFGRRRGVLNRFGGCDRAPCCRPRPGRDCGER